MVDENLPMVTIWCLAYNHQDYIRQCLDGFVMQKTNFKFEAIVHEDASTDGTAAIVREYAEKHPDIIKPIFETENQWHKTDGSLDRIFIENCTGKYVAMCEGDDFWTDSLKLQKQVDFLESHPDYSMCFHNAMNLWEDGHMEPFSAVEDREYTAEDIFSNWMVPTASVVFKKDVIDSVFFKTTILGANLLYGDTPLFLSCAKFGNVRGISDCMSIYRRHEGSLSRGFTSESYKKLMLYCCQLGQIFEMPELASKAIVRDAVDGFFHSLRSNTEKTDFSFLRDSFKADWKYTVKVLSKRLSSNL